MMAGDFNRTTAARGDSETGLDSAVDPCMNVTRLHGSIPAETKYRRNPTSDSFLDGQSLPGRRIINQCISPRALSHARPARHGAQGRVFETASHPVQVVET